MFYSQIVPALRLKFSHQKPIASLSRLCILYRENSVVEIFAYEIGFNAAIASTVNGEELGGCYSHFLDLFVLVDEAVGALVVEPYAKSKAIGEDPWDWSIFRDGETTIQSLEVEEALGTLSLGILLEDNVLYEPDGIIQEVGIQLFIVKILGQMLVDSIEMAPVKLIVLE